MLARPERFFEDRFGLTSNSFVVEVASKDGYLLQYFLRQGIPILGIEPAANVAVVYRAGYADVPSDLWLAAAKCSAQTT